jgi:hypothetical protein
MEAGFGGGVNKEVGHGSVGLDVWFGSANTLRDEDSPCICRLYQLLPFQTEAGWANYLISRQLKPILTLKSAKATAPKCLQNARNGVRNLQNAKLGLADYRGSQK